ncbi:hypothetical protein [Candidatus Sulfurimonas baltica]|uniref:Uncharacterized protein n=1 Tax=Candidatus Sulfurimonas baltica TaxID=2740404 RepID=A0A7S7RNI1_9BACT|nr:hypothetical protein [Candidatus Sulfurimonas baltica]QOY52571.1 hypothetical protein HUE88_02460 [Candidatus Sulfurimonas baltica]
MFDDLLRDLNSCNLIYFRKSDVIDQVLYLYSGIGSDTLKIRDLVAISNVLNSEQYDMLYHGDLIKITQNIA